MGYDAESIAVGIQTYGKNKVAHDGAARLGVIPFQDWANAWLSLRRKYINTDITKSLQSKRCLTLQV